MEFSKTQALTSFKKSLLRQTASEEQSDLWMPLAFQGWKPCTESVAASIVVAKILNATLVIPYLDVNRVWQDSSTFKDIFDMDHFINALKDYISIVKELPDEFSWSTRVLCNCHSTNQNQDSTSSCFCKLVFGECITVLQSYGIAAIAPFSHRLTFDNLPKYFQHLRCKVNFQALVFVPHIRHLRDVLVNRLRDSSTKATMVGGNYLKKVTEKYKQGSGKFVVLHLRFDKDMAAHSACDFGGGKAEKLALAKYRQVIWQGRVLNSQFTDEELRSQGRCPLTPEEIGLLLAALGFDNSTRLYLASHKVYGGEVRISTLRSLFPLMDDSKSLASSDERAFIKGKASLLAAVDYYISMHSDVFISSSPGNMHNAMGTRTGKGKSNFANPINQYNTYPAPDCMYQG
ncbi:hypothetical protein T459_14920 [Capsicum annuum]|uniref:O-fucosyltransferase family protein n=1 Tax=Capsicum annuum TaxID=4072 RepID=A0A2G2ZIZ7_CAPAN|nr:hypothetical protein T459_14920 [Capsicum annuum]